MSEEQVVDVPALPIVDDTAEKLIVEGVMEIPQEPFPEEIEEQFGPILVPQSVCYVAPFRCSSACRNPCRDRLALCTNASG